MNTLNIGESRYGSTDIIQASCKNKISAWLEPFSKQKLLKICEDNRVCLKQVASRSISPTYFYGHEFSILCLCAGSNNYKELHQKTGLDQKLT